MHAIIFMVNTRNIHTLSPYLFVIRMETLSSLIKSVVIGGFLSSCTVKGYKSHICCLLMAHLFFVRLHKTRWLT